MITLNVNLGEHSYPIYIGQDVLSQKDLFERHINSKQVVIVSNTTVAPLYIEKVKASLGEYDLLEHIIEDGEVYKNLKVMELLITDLLKNKFSRNASLIALGGGVVGDLSGFVAACYQRGIPFIQIPTTLLAQVDSSVGGKTAVNHQLGKNMIGAFHQPVAVISDTNVLDTLDDRQLIAGIAEVIKYGLIRDFEFFVWLENNIDKLLARDSSALTYAIERSCQNKAEIVQQDETEQGVRALLNLGHTFGHAIETAQQYKGLLHGEAVGLGMIMAAEFSLRKQWLKESDVQRITTLISRSDLPTELPPGISMEQLLANMAVDKKAKDGKVSFILMKAIGDAVITNDFEQQDLINTLEHFMPKESVQ